MRIIILFLFALPLYECFHFLHLHIPIPIPKNTNLYYCIDSNSKIHDNDEKNNTGAETQTRESAILKTDPNKKKLSYKHTLKGSGIDERYSTTHDETEYQTQMEKLAKFSYQMKLLKKLERNNHADPCKLEAIEEYNYLFEKRKYLTNIEAGGLYHSWDDPGF
jgi:hypothetical protein